MKNRKLTAALLLLMAAATPGAQAETLRVGRDDCRSMALRHSEELKKADNAVRQAELDVKIARTSYLPKFDGSATGIYMTPDIDMMGSKLQVKGAYMAGIQLVQPIYAGGKITAGNKLARIGRDVAGEQRRMCRMDVIADADNAYWTYIAVLDKVRLLEDYKNMVDTLYSQTEVAVEAGMAMGNDLLRIGSKRSEIIYQMQKAANGAELCRMSLCNIIGADPGTEIVPADSLPDCMAPGDLTVDIASRPELHLLQHQIDTSRQQVNMTRGDFLPTVGLSLGYNYYGNIKLKGMVDAGGGMYVPFSQENKGGIGMGVLSVSIPLFHWGEGMKKVKKARLAVDNAILDLEHTRSLLDLEARQAAANLTDGWNMIEAARTALDQSAENLRVMRDRYDEKVSPLSDLLDAQTQWRQARSNMIEAATQYQIYQTAWLRANGRLGD